MFDDDDDKACIRRKIGMPAAAGPIAVVVTVSALGLEGNSQFRDGFLEKTKLVFTGNRYEANLNCGSYKKYGPLVAMARGFAGADRYLFRAPGDEAARSKAARRTPAGCKLMSLYRLEPYPWSDKYDQHKRI